MMMKQFIACVCLVEFFFPRGGFLGMAAQLARHERSTEAYRGTSTRPIELAHGGRQKFAANSQRLQAATAERPIA
jgi:hypothetical protein